MAGLNYGNLFDRGMDFDDQGRARIATGSEDAGRYKTAIMKSNSILDGTATTTTLYTVPANKVFYITSVTLAGTIAQPASGGAITQAQMFMTFDSENIELPLIHALVMYKTLPAGTV